MRELSNLHIELFMVRNKRMISWWIIILGRSAFI